MHYSGREGVVVEEEWGGVDVGARDLGGIFVFAFQLCSELLI